MDPRSFSGKDPQPVVRVANVLVIVALVAMLIGAVVLLLARDHSVMDIPPGEQRVVLEGKAASWDPWGAQMGVRASSAHNETSNVIVSATMSAPMQRHESQQLEVVSGSPVRWERSADRGEDWQVSVENQGDERVRVSATMSQLGHYWVGGALVVFGVFGFVFHRLGMRTGD